MSKLEAAYFRKRDFRVSAVLTAGESSLSEAFARAVLRARPSRLDNVLEIEILHKPDEPILAAIDYVCLNGIDGMVILTIHPTGSKMAGDPSCYMRFDYHDGRVIDQWTEMSARPDDAEDHLVDLMKISFTRKEIIDSVWVDDAQPFTLTVIAGTDQGKPTNDLLTP